MICSNRELIIGVGLLMSFCSFGYLPNFLGILIIVDARVNRVVSESARSQISKTARQLIGQRVGKVTGRADLYTRSEKSADLRALDSEEALHLPADGAQRMSVVVSATGVDSSYGTNLDRRSIQRGLTATSAP